MEDFKIHPVGILRYVVVLLVSLLLWWFFRTYELFIILLLIIASVPVSIAMAWRFRASFSLQINLPSGGIGREHGVPMSIKIRSLCRFIGFASDVSYVVRNVFTEYEAKGKARAWVAPGVTTVIEKELLSHHVGRVEVCVTKFVIWDWLGIIRLDCKAQKSAWVIVAPTPKVSNEEELVMAIENFPDDNETKKHGTDVNPDYEIREYVPGDELKSIHWKLTAKTGRTMVRERLASGRDKINVLLALTENEEENDGLTASLHGLSLLLLNKGYPIRLLWLGAGGTLQGRYVAEEGELENAMDEILSVSGKKSQDKARNAMETEFPGESYVIVKNGAYKGAYVRG